MFRSFRRILTQLQGFNVGAEEDDDDEQEMRWDWDVPPPPAVMRGGHLHHHHHRPQFEMFGMIGGDSFRGTFIISLLCRTVTTNWL